MVEQGGNIQGHLTTKNWDNITLGNRGDDLQTKLFIRSEDKTPICQ